MGRQLAFAVLADLPSVRLREIVSITGHYISGTLDRDSFLNAFDSLCVSSQLKPGDRVQTLRGSLSGVITGILEDGRIEWKPDNSSSSLRALPESLIPCNLSGPKAKP